VFGSLAFSAFAWLLRVTTPAKVTTYAYVNPVVALFLGWLILGEAISTQTIVAAGIIIAAVFLMTTDRPKRVAVVVAEPVAESVAWE
jgi:drug/metabolite transporter (DMT)-like permease